MPIMTRLVIIREYGIITPIGQPKLMKIPMSLIGQLVIHLYLAQLFGKAPLIRPVIKIIMALNSG